MTPEPPGQVPGEAEADLASALADLFRAALRALSASDPTQPIVQTIRSLATILNQLEQPDLGISFNVLEDAFRQLQDPADRADADDRRLQVARAGMRYLATVTDVQKRNRPGYWSRLSRDRQHFDECLDRSAGMGRE